MSWKSLPEQRPNAGGAKADSQEALEVTAEKSMFREGRAEILFRRFLPYHQQEMAPMGYKASTQNRWTEKQMRK